MAIKVVDGNQVHGKFDQLLKNFMPYAKEKLGYDKHVDLQLVSDPENAKDPLGKTAYYDPNLMRITLFVDKRHVKDILRSLSHELVHHKQNCEGQLSNIATEEGYAQRDPHMRKMEGEAYLLGNGFLIRDWEDKLKGDKQVYEDIMQEARERPNKLINELAEPVMPDTGEMTGMTPSSPPGAGGGLDAFRQALSQNDEIPPELIEPIIDMAKNTLGVGAMMNEDFIHSYKSLEKPLYSAHKSKESAREVAKKIKKRLRENQNWATVQKEARILKELKKRWCK